MAVSLAILRYRRRGIAALMAWTALDVLACKPRETASSEVKASNGPGAGQHAIPLASFNYRLAPVAYREISARIGCNAAARILTAPAADLPAVVGELVLSRTFYEDMKAKLSSDKAAKQNCGAAAKVGTGLARLKERAGGPLTVVIVGGTGAAQQPEGSLAESQKAWQSDGVTVVRADCQKGFASIATCAGELTTKLREVADKASGDASVLIWAHGKGGLFAMDALAEVPELREKTLAVVTVGTPFGGATAGTISKDTMKTVAKTLQNLTGQDTSMFETNPALALMTPLESFLGDNVATQWWKAEAADIVKANEELSPNAAVSRLEALKAKNFAKANGEAIPVFHVASALDLSYLTPFPPFKVKANGLELATEQMNWNQLLAFLAVDAFREYPLNDGFVAMEHAVFPTQLTPTGLSPKLLALFKIDHMGMTFSSSYQVQSELPNAAIVDGLLAAMAASLAGGDQ